MGGRHLEEYAPQSFQGCRANSRHPAGSHFLHDDDKRRASLRKCLETVSDIERITTRICPQPLPAGRFYRPAPEPSHSAANTPAFVNRQGRAAACCRQAAFRLG